MWEVMKEVPCVEVGRSRRERQGGGGGGCRRDHLPGKDRDLECKERSGE